MTLLLHPRKLLCECVSRSQPIFSKLLTRSVTILGGQEKPVRYKRTKTETQKPRAREMASPKSVSCIKEQNFNYFLVLDFEATCDDKKKPVPQVIDFLPFK